VQTYTPMVRCTHRTPVNSSWGVVMGGDQITHGHGRLCWLSQNRAEKQSCIEHLEVREIDYMPLVTRTPLALAIDRRDFTNRVRCWPGLPGSQ
jgi:hypothetical protein